MTSLSCSSTGDATNLANLISAHVTSPSQVIYKSATLVSTFAGDACTFGQSNVNTGWASVRNLLSAKKITIHLIPAIFPNPSTFPSLPWLDGELNWNSGWPTAGRDLDGSSDTLYMQDLGNKTYMPAISPCFFTYYGPNTYNKDWIYRSDDWLLAMRMEMIVAMRNKVDFAEIISWNGRSLSSIHPSIADNGANQTTGRAITSARCE